jgi:NADPH2:quinone reductase
MKAIRITAYGGPEVMHLETVDRPKPGAGEVLVRIEAAGVNYIDVYFRTGQYKAELPFTPGQEGAGVVEAVGSDIGEWRVGDRVAFQSGKGTYAESAIVSAAHLVKLPNDLTTRIGAAMMLQGMTAHYLACSLYPLRPGDTCLVHAAAGGVGLLLVQIAKLRGARVLATVGTEEKAQLARQMGADDVIVYTREEFPAAVRRLTGGKGVKVVFDSVGRTTFDGSLDSLVPRGTMVLFGQSSGAVPPMDPQVLNRKGSLFLTRPTLAHYIATRTELLERANALFGWMREGKLTVRIGDELPLGEAAEGHRRLEGRLTTGKVVLVPQS